MKRAVIIGCGFARVNAALGLCGFRRILELTIIDKNPYFNFLPCLPDVVGRDIRPEYLRYILSVWWSYGLRNKFGLIADLLKR